MWVRIGFGWHCDGVGAMGLEWLDWDVGGICCRTDIPITSTAAHAQTMDGWMAQKGIRPAAGPPLPHRRKRKGGDLDDAAQHVGAHAQQPGARGEVLAQDAGVGAEPGQLARGLFLQRLADGAGAGGQHRDENGEPQHAGQSNRPLFVPGSDARGPEEMRQTRIFHSAARVSASGPGPGTAGSPLIRLPTAGPQNAPATLHRPPR
jgi:hypothetical protein